jgi:hypothetical protein
MRRNRATRRSSPSAELTASMPVLPGWVCVGPARPCRGWGSERWERRRALDSTVLNDAVAFGEQTATGSTVAIHESDGAPDEKERRPKHQHLVTNRACWRSEMWPRRQERVSRLTQAHRAVPS